MADNVQGTSPSHKANHFVELLAEAENIARDLEPAAELFIPPRYKPYIAFAQGLMNAFDLTEGPTVADAAVATGNTERDTLEAHAVLQNELMTRAPLPDPPNANVTGTQKP